MGFLVTCTPVWGYVSLPIMSHTFSQKFMLVVLAAALTAGGYVFVWKKLILGADQAVNGGYSKPGAAATPVVKRRY